MTEDRSPTPETLVAENAALRETIRQLQTALDRASGVTGDEPALGDQPPALAEFAPFAIEKLSDGVYLITKDGHIVYVNEAAARNMGYRREDMIGMSMLRINQAITQETWDAVWKVTARQKKQAIEGEHIAKDGRLVPLEIVANHIELRGKEYSCAFTRDITERKREEAARRKEHAFTQGIIDTAPVIVLLLDADGRILRFNDYTAHMIGYTLDEVRGRDWIDLVVPETERERIKKMFGSAVGGTSTRGYINNIQTRSGDTRSIIWYDTTLCDEDTQETMLLSIGQDVTEQRRMEQRIRQSEKLEALGQLAGGIAHDFNNQLAGIVGFADILQTELDGRPDLLDYVDSIITSAERSADLTGQLLAFSRRGKFLTKPVNVDGVIRDVVAILKHSVDKRITIETRFGHHRAITLGDPAQLQSALLNLGINARDAMPDGGTLAYATSVVELGEETCRKIPYAMQPGSYILIQVTDTGLGMDEATRNRIFEPFFTTKDRGKGTGMGLSAVYGTVKNHRGAINVDSEPGRGTEFKLYLPLIKNRRTEEDLTTESPELPSFSGQILLVEDEADVAKMTASMLTHLGCRVQVAGNGREAVEIFRNSHRDIDLVILDLVMPELSGRDTYHRLRAIDPGVVAFIASGFSLDGEVQNLLDEGAQAFIPKPYRLADLARQLAEFLPPAADLPNNNNNAS